MNWERTWWNICDAVNGFFHGVWNAFVISLQLLLVALLLIVCSAFAGILVFVAYKSFMYFYGTGA